MEGVIFFPPMSKIVFVMLCCTAFSIKRYKVFMAADNPNEINEKVYNCNIPETGIIKQEVRA